jgi:hypothetical protein
VVHQRASARKKSTFWTTATGDEEPGKFPGACPEIKARGFTLGFIPFELIIVLLLYFNFISIPENPEK